MSKKALDKLKKEFGDRILETSNFRGDEEATVARKDWKKVATFLREDPNLSMDHFIDITAADYSSSSTSHAESLQEQYPVGETVQVRAG